MAKRKKTPAPDSLEQWEEGSSRRLWDWNVSEKGYGLSYQEVKTLVERCLEWWVGDGGLKADWVAVCRTWIRKEVEEFGPNSKPPRIYTRKVWPGASARKDEGARGSRSPEEPLDAIATPGQADSEQMVAFSIDKVADVIPLRRMKG